MRVGSLFSAANTVVTKRRVCPDCGGKKDFYAMQCRSCSPSPKGCKGRIGKQHPAWKGGFYIDADGYKRTYAPDHPWPRKGGYIYEQVRVMECQLGRRLDHHKESVHHINHNKLDNRWLNLQLVKRGVHSSYHRHLDTHLRKRDALGRFAPREEV